MSTTGSCSNTAALPSCGSAHGAGFTLLELLVTVALIVLVGALAMPRLQLFLQGDSLETCARQTIGFIRQSAQRARQRQQAYVLRYAAEQHALVVEAAEDAEMGKRQKRQQTQGESGQGRTYSLHLPETVHVAAIHAKRSHFTAKHGQGPRLYITSKGYAEPALIVLAARDGGKQLSLVASPFLGRIRVVEGYADPAATELFR